MYSKGAVNIDFENQYYLSSGVKSPLYIEAGVLVSSFDARADIAGALLFWINEHCREQKTKVDAVVGNHTAEGFGDPPHFNCIIFIIS